MFAEILLDKQNLKIKIGDHYEKTSVLRANQP